MALPSSEEAILRALVCELQKLEADISIELDERAARRILAKCEQVLQLLSRASNADLSVAVQGTRANALAYLGEISGDKLILSQAVEAYNTVLAALSATRAPLDWAMTHGNRAMALHALGKIAGDIVTLRQALEGYDAAVPILAARAPRGDWAGVINNRANALASAGRLISDSSLLRRAISDFDTVLAVFGRSTASKHWAMAQDNRANVLSSLGLLTGHTEVLQQAIDGHDAALTVYTRGEAPLNWAAAKNNRAVALRRLASLVGDATLLREAVADFSAALCVRTQERMPAAWAETCNNLANALLDLGKWTHDATLLRRAVDEYDHALIVRTREAAPADWSSTQQNRAISLSVLGDLTGDLVVLQQAIDGFSAALLERSKSEMPRSWATTQINRANALRCFGFISGDVSTLRRAVAGFDAALAAINPKSAPSFWALAQHNRGNAFASLHRLGDPSAGSQAVSAYRNALALLIRSGAEDQHQSTATALARLLVRQVGTASGASGQAAYRQAAQVIERSLALSDRALLTVGRSRAGRERAVRLVEELYALRALCHLRLGDTDGAAEAAEAGRQRLAMETRAMAVEQADRLNDPEVRAAVEPAEQRRRALLWQLGHGPDRDARDNRPALSAEQRDGLLAELEVAQETLLGLYKQHGLIPEIEALSAATIIAAAPEGGALVLPVIAPGQAHALVIANGRITPIDLRSLDPVIPNVDQTVLHRRVITDPDSWLRRYYAMREAAGDKQLRRGSPAFQEWSDHLTGTLHWLWTVLLGPLDAHLRDPQGANLRPGAQVVILPTGLLGLLPLSAAMERGGDTPFGEHWTVSLAPSVRTLLDCRERATAAAARPPRLLGLLDPDNSLPAARAEQQVLELAFAHAEQDYLVGKQATHDRLLALLVGTTLWHASTHGEHNPHDPSLSALLLAGGDKLRLRDLSGARLGELRLAFLSACETGLAGVMDLPEEYQGLAGGLVLGGAAAVAASLWPVFEDTSYLLAIAFYAELFDERGRERQSPAEALRAAQRFIRTVRCGELRQAITDTGYAGPDRIRRAIAAVAGEPAAAEPRPVTLGARIVSLFRGQRGVGGDAVPGAPGGTLGAILARLGADDEPAFPSPHDWGSLAVTGA